MIDTAASGLGEDNSSEHTNVLSNRPPPEAHSGDTMPASLAAESSLEQDNDMVYNKLQAALFEAGVNSREVSTAQWQTFTLVTHQTLRQKALEAKTQANDAERIIVVPEGPFRERLRRYHEAIHARPIYQAPLQKHGVQYFYDHPRLASHFPEVAYAFKLQEQLEGDGAETAADIMFDVLAVYSQCIDEMIQVAQERARINQATGHPAKPRTDF